MVDYAKKTVAELTEILKSRGLPSSGKKAELVARLSENDKEAEVADETPAPQPEPVAAAATTAAATPAAVPSEPPAQPPQAEDGAPTDTGAAVSGTEEATTTTAQPNTESITYTLNLKASDLDSELAKRKARAERFGTSATTITTTTNGSEANPSETPQATENNNDNNNDTNTQALKNLERAKRFGTQTTAISKLDEALPTERARGNKRKAEDPAKTSLSSSALDDPGLKKSFAARAGSGAGAGAGGSAGGRYRNRGSHRQGPTRGAGGTAGGGGISKPTSTSTSAPAYTSEKDKLAAEARKKKFATA